MPVSVTVMTAWPPSRDTRSAIRPPGSVNLAALCRMLPTTCTSRVLSPSTVSGSSGSSMASSCRRASMAGRAVSTARATIAPTSTGSRCSVIMPRVMRDTSSRSSIRRTRCSTWRSMMSRAEARCGSASSFSRSSCTAVRIGASGLRSSCASIARNSSLRRSASCSAAVVASSSAVRSATRALELAVQPLERPRLPVQLGEDADLGAQDLGHDRHRHVVHGAALVAAQPVEVGQHDRRHEDDRRLLEARMLRGSSPPARSRRAPACRRRPARRRSRVLQQVLERLASPSWP